MTTGGSAGSTESTAGPDRAEPPGGEDEDEASRESFPASDPPSSWAGEEFTQPDPPSPL
jgi:hypothetical protein